MEIDLTCYEEKHSLAVMQTSDKASWQAHFSGKELATIGPKQFLCKIITDRNKCHLPTLHAESAI